MPARGQSPQRAVLCPIPSGFIHKLFVHPRDVRAAWTCALRELPRLVRCGVFLVCDALPRHTRNPVCRCSIWRRRRRSTASSGGFISGVDDVVLASWSLECTSELGWFRGEQCAVAPNHKEGNLLLSVWPAVDCPPLVACDGLAPCA